MFSIWGLLREGTEEGGWRGWKEEEKPRQTDRQERRSGAGREGDERSENRKGGGERRSQGDQRGASDTEQAAGPLFAGGVTSTMRIQGKPSNSGCSSSPGQGGRDGCGHLGALAARTGT